MVLTGVFSPMHWRVVVTATVATVAAVLGIPTGAAAVPAEGSIRPAGSTEVVPDSYLVALAPGVVHSTKSDVDTMSWRLARRFGGTVGQVFRSTSYGFEVRINEAGARRLAADPAVDYVRRNGRVILDSEQSNPPSWGLDRIDHHGAKLNGIYDYPRLASGVRVYVIDSGVNLIHSDLSGRVVSGWNVLTNSPNASDCFGHGSHVAGTIGGTEYGVAKGVTIIGVRVTDCYGAGSAATIRAGVDWVRQNLVTPAVVNISLGVSAESLLDGAVNELIAVGATVVVSAGNDGANACNRSPARVSAAITVAATDRSDGRPSWSNYGSCVDIFAPGVEIVSHGGYGSDWAVMSGTSMAAPHVAGAAALVLGGWPSATPGEVRNHLVNVDASSSVDNAGSGSPRKRLRIPAMDAAIGCTSSASTVYCDGGAMDGVAPYSIQWIPFSEYDVTYVSAACVPGEYIDVTAHFTDAAGTQRTATTGVSCTDMN